MKKLLLTVFAVLSVVVLNAQQPTFWGDNTQGANGETLIDVSCLLSQDYEKIESYDKFEYSDPDREKVVAKFKAVGVKKAFSPYKNKYGKFVQKTLEWHGGELVKVPSENIYHRRKEYRAFASEFYVRKKCYDSNCI